MKSAHVIFNEGEAEDVINPGEVFSRLIDYEIHLEDEMSRQGSSPVSSQPVGTSPEDQLPSSTSTSQNQNSLSVSNDEVLSDVVSPTTPTTTRTRPRVNYQNLHRYGSVFSVEEVDPLVEPRCRK
jgi:hypothetical protein